MDPTFNTFAFLAKAKSQNRHKIFRGDGGEFTMLILLFPRKVYISFDEFLVISKVF